MWNHMLPAGFCLGHMQPTTLRSQVSPEQVFMRSPCEKGPTACSCLSFSFSAEGRRQFDETSGILRYSIGPSFPKFQSWTTNCSRNESAGWWRANVEDTCYVFGGLIGFSSKMPMRPEGSHTWPHPSVARIETHSKHSFLGLIEHTYN